MLLLLLFNKVVYVVFVASSSSSSSDKTVISQHKLDHGGVSVQSGRRRVRPGGPIGRVVQPRSVSNHAEANRARVVPGHASESRIEERSEGEGL